MKIVGALIALLVALFLYGAYLEKESPGQWRIVWDNFGKSYSVVSLAKDTTAVFMKETVKPQALSADEMEQVVYRWVENGVTHTSYQRPSHVENVQAIRLGDLDYKVEKSLTEEEKNKLLNKPKQ
ncbi:MAG: hypothetical protein HWE13_08350 [Gammaproteobacteria bacterium]|nr:hypothetical protein [Gammaproteobacteria bacterium]NVK88123.1 hypothetical protein [Gammaproteobacteria bacterium]